jgi:hypothetical protein
LFIFAPETQASKQVVGAKECPKAHSGAPVSMISHCKDKDIFPDYLQSKQEKTKSKTKK